MFSYYILFIPQSTKHLFAKHYAGYHHSKNVIRPLLLRSIKHKGQVQIMPLGKKKSVFPLPGLPGVFFPHPMISKSESVTYLTKDEETVHVFHAHNQYVLLVTFLFFGGEE